MHKNKNNKGFTLIELLVVIVIIGLLATVVLLGLNGARQKARDSKRVEDMNQVSKALEIFFNDANAYPTGSADGLTSADNTILGSVELTALTAGGQLVFFTPTYLRTLPTAPIPADSATCNNNNNYLYNVDFTGTTYTLTFCTGSTLGGTNGILGNPGIHRLTPGGFQ
jgi:type II secretion system protein G